MQRYIRAYRADDGAKDTDGPIRFVASTEALGRDGLVIAADAWDLEPYRANPVFLWVHDYRGQRLPLGRTEVELDLSVRKLYSDVTFDRDDPFAVDVERKYRGGFLNAVSVGWDTHEIKYTDDDKPPTVTRAELLDISGVPVPGDPTALIERELAAVRSLLGGDDPFVERIAARVAELLAPKRAVETIELPVVESFEDPGIVRAAEEILSKLTTITPPSP